MNRLILSAVLMAAAGVLSADAAYFTIDGINYKTLDDSTVAVDGCGSSLTEITVPATVDHNGRSYSVVSIAESSFSSNRSLVTLRAAESVKEVGRQAFFLASALREVYLPGVTTLGEDAFYLSGVGKVVLSDELTELPKDAFDGTKSKLELDLSHVKIIGKTALRKCVMDNAVLSDGISLAQGAFQESQIAAMTVTGTVSLPAGTTVFDRGKVTDLTLVDVDFSSNRDAFNPTAENMTILQKDKTTLSLSMKISAKTLYLDFDAAALQPAYGTAASPFNYMSTLEKVTAGPLLRLVYDDMFSNCSKLNSVILSASLTEVGNYAFGNCNAIKTVECAAMIPPVCAGDAFPATVYKNAVLKVPEGCAEAYMNADGWKQFATIEGSLAGIGDAVTDSECAVRICGDRMCFICPEGTQVSVYSIDGRLVYAGAAVELMPGHGVYIVRVGGTIMRVAV